MSSKTKVQRAAEWNKTNPDTRKEIQKKYYESHKRLKVPSEVKEERQVKATYKEFLNLAKLPQIYKVQIAI